MKLTNEQIQQITKLLNFLNTKCKEPVFRLIKENIDDYSFLFSLPEFEIELKVNEIVKKN